MSPIKSNLEPIEESDLDLESKIKKGFTKENHRSTIALNDGKVSPCLQR